jgi:ketosteroid isomerase-like protein
MLRARPNSLAMAVIASLLVATAAVAHPAAQAAIRAPTGPLANAAAARVVDDFHAALARGDTSAAAGLLSEAVIIFEGGSAERSLTEYATAHLPADAALEQAVVSQLVRRSGETFGDMAWIASEGRTNGQFKGRDVDRVTTETAVLRRVDGRWRIVHVHWSSHAAQAGN